MSRDLNLTSMKKMIKLLFLFKGSKMHASHSDIKGSLTNGARDKDGKRWKKQALSC
jgi:hypothetical protein